VDETPIAQITGAQSGLAGPFVTVGPDRTVYVANCSANTITTFAATADGNVAPSRRIAGGTTGLSCPQGIGLGPDGSIYVSNNYSADASQVLVFAATAEGNVAPIRTLAGPDTRLKFPTRVLVDSAGDTYVTTAGDTPEVLIYEPDATGNVAPKRYLRTGLAGPTGLALDSAGRVYVSNANVNNVVVYAPNATGLAPPVAVLTDASLAVPSGVALDSQGAVYVSSQQGNSISIFRPVDLGSPSLVRLIKGPNTTMSLPTGVAIDPNGHVLVGNWGETPEMTAVLRFAPTAPYAPRLVKALPADRSIAASWSPPAYGGGAPVSSYTAVASPGGATCTTALTGCRLTGLTNGVQYAITVVATNTGGSSAPSTPAAQAMPVPPVPRVVTRPLVVGPMRVDRTVQCAVSYAGAKSVTYTWSRNGARIPNARSVFYRLNQSDFRRSISCSATGANLGGKAPAVTSPGRVVGRGKAPAASRNPNWTGVTEVGRKVRVTYPGTWTPQAESFKCRWLRNGKPIKAAKVCKRYRVREADANKRLSVRVTAYRYGHKSGRAFSVARRIA
jgi:sugar lactone lactonase YvrE